MGFLLFWLQRLLYGPLRPIETEQLYEKAWFAVTETCLAMTIFRGELGGWFLVMFICLLVGKVWGWIGEGRVEFLEQQPPANPRLFHTRLAASLAVSVLFNAFMLRFCVHTVLEQARPDIMVMFGFEFAVLSILSLSTAARYGISLVEIHVTQQQMKAKVAERRSEIRAAREEAIQQQAQSGGDAPTDLPDENDINEMELDIPGWEEKGRWIFYLDLATDFFKLTVYLSFFAILFTFYGLPIHILRDVVLTIRSFGRRIVDFVRYRNATRDMNERYPDATADEISREDVCIICREEMIPWQAPDQAGAAGRLGGAQRIPERLRPKKLPCGHILHFACLRSWLERQQNCPTCRRPVIMPLNRGHAGDGDQGGAGPQNIPGGRNGPQADGLPRARVYQFGPFRIGFGAGRGDLFRNLHQQIHQGNAPVQPPGNFNPPGARQVGFGFGFGRPPQAAPAAAVPPAPTPPITQPTPPSLTASSTNIQNQLHHVEQQISHELDSLRLSIHQLQLVRLLQAELQRLRNQQNATPDAQGTPVLGTPAMGTPLQGPTTFPASSTPAPTATTSVTTRRQFTSNPQAPPLTSGDSRLPEGLSLPQGWSLIPLQSADQQPNTQSGAETAIPTAPSVPSSPLPGGPLGDHLTSDHPSDDPPITQPSASTENVGDQIRSGETAESVSSGATRGLPSWGLESMADPTGQSAEPPAHAQTDPASNQPQEETEGPSTAATADEEPRQDAENSNTDEGSSVSSKGKGRAATVEDVADDEP